PRVTREGEQHPVFAGYADFFTLGHPDHEKVALDGAARATEIKPGATVLAEHPTDMLAGGGAQPVLLWQRYGAGKVLCLLADSTCRWYLPLKGLGRASPYARFWAQSLRWLAGRADEPSDARLVVRVEPAEVAPGEWARVIVESRLPAGAPLAARLALPDGSSEPVELRAGAADGSGVSLSMGRVRAAQKGTHTVAVQGVDEKGAAVETSGSFIAGGELAEFRRAGLDEAYLRETASRSGGKYFTVLDAKTLPDHLRRGVLLRAAREEIHPFNSPLFFAVFLGLLGAEWVLRRRRMLL
ncbi:MAG: hypothetical protein HY719_03645, partial [Planctomycetes bacterium]|nr:hypothetical protein [Planctomycetota bacterium]